MYDNLTWHPEDTGAHVGRFLAWALLRGLGSPEFWDDEALSRFRDRRQTGHDLLVECCDGKLTDEEFGDEGNRFAEAYYVTGLFAADHEEALGSAAREDEWACTEALLPVLDRRLEQWRAGTLQVPPPPGRLAAWGAEARQLVRWWRGRHIIERVLMVGGTLCFFLGLMLGVDAITVAGVLAAPTGFLIAFVREWL
jgi:hypothetical protein